MAALTRCTSTIGSGLTLIKDPPAASGEGQIKTAMKLDYETKDMYMVVVTATDPSGASDSIMVTIMVTDGPDDPPDDNPGAGI